MQTPKEWEKGFDSKFTTPALRGTEGDEETCQNCGEDLSLETYDWFDKGYMLAVQDIKPFISSLIEERERWLVNKISGMEKELHYADGGELSYYSHTKTEGYNQAINEILSLLTQDKQ